MISSGVMQDRLGSIGHYYPYGEAYAGSAPITEAFATYYRDSSTLDYAQNRYYASSLARFTSADPYVTSAGPADPGSWNRYGYVSGDPVNRNDRSGLCDVVIGGIRQNEDSSDALTGFGAEAITAFPYSSTAGQNIVTGIIKGSLGVATQALNANSATQTALAAILLAAKDPGPINVTTFSGGTAAFEAAFSFLPNDIKGRIDNITYISPASLSGSPLPKGNGDTTAILGSGFVDTLFTLGTVIPLGADVIHSDKCGHDANCLITQYQDLLNRKSGNACSNPRILQQLYKDNYRPIRMPSIIGPDPFYWLNYMLNVLTQPPQPAVVPEV